ncbi:MAG: hypothetical protein ACD_28C00178G0003 [uncultured bacterium]|nr:MAG: hypothetical protein ACD_28C00178G0003 [uncultured bacterium]
MKRLFSGLLILFTLLSPLQAAFAQSTLLPEGAAEEDCDNIMSQNPSSIMEGVKNPFLRDIYLGCAIQTGKLRLWMLPFFITYFIDFFIGIAGTISVLFVMLGGFWYITGGIVDDKEKGKNTIKWALVGLGITLLAWILVNVIQVQVSG